VEDRPDTEGQTVRDPEGRRVELPDHVWRSKILRDHPELVGWHAEVLAGASTGKVSDPVAGCSWS
jgi:hypothetical protein